MKGGEKLLKEIYFHIWKLMSYAYQPFYYLPNVGLLLISLFVLVYCKLLLGVFHAGFTFYPISTYVSVFDNATHHQKLGRTTFYEERFHDCIIYLSLSDTILHL